MLPDFLSALFRTISFVALFQAAGTAIFMVIFGRMLAQSATRIQHIGWVAAIIALVAVSAHFFLEAARMAGEMAGVLDVSLHQMVVESRTGTMVGLRVIGLFLLAISLRGRHWLHGNVALLGAVIALISFIVMGHTAVHPDRSMLAILLLTHLFAVAFWFGALAPLYLVSTHESMRVASKVIDAFSAIALWLVPGLLILGILMAVQLMPSVQALNTPYGKLLLAKVTGFVLLMLLAAANKWRFAPAINRGEMDAIQPFQRAVATEYVLIALVLGVTAVMTGFYSPDG